VIFNTNGEKPTCLVPRKSNEHKFKSTAHQKLLNEILGRRLVSPTHPSTDSSPGSAIHDCQEQIQRLPRNQSSREAMKPVKTLQRRKGPGMAAKKDPETRVRR
jgi:hypothetical protein